MIRGRSGLLRINDLNWLRRRAGRSNDPRWIFYAAMLASSSIDDYFAAVGDVVVYPATYKGKVSADAELNYAVYQRKWLSITQPGSSWSDDWFRPDPLRDERLKTYREIIQRQGQAKFRQALLKAYDGTCAISGCTIPQLLEAAHITPYLGEYTNHIGNGILLRADLHTLWDQAMLAVDPTTLRLKFAEFVCSTDAYYCSLNNAALRLPSSEAHRPSREALTAQWTEFLAAC
jgi:hypothetical protein